MFFAGGLDNEDNNDEPVNLNEAARSSSRLASLNAQKGCNINNNKKGIAKKV